MRPFFILVAALFFFLRPAEAQTPPQPPAGVFENVTIGEPMVNLRMMLGDPIRVTTFGQAVIWRYLSHGDGVYIDVLVKNNVAQSVTVVPRVDGVRYADPRGAAFGMTPDQVRAKFGPPTRESINADDGSLDLWYYAPPYARIYEFHSNKLDFIQLVASPALLSTFASGPAATPDDGTSLEHAIWIRPSNFLSDAVWIDVFFATNGCGKGGHWKEGSLKLAPVAAKSDPLAYTVVHASCTDGSGERDFYFDTRGTATSHGNQTTIYVDPNQLPVFPASPTPSPPPHPRH
jgi:hypothetical protein